MKKYKFIFEETFTSGSRRKSLVYDIKSAKDWQLLLEDLKSTQERDPYLQNHPEQMMDLSKYDINKPSQNPNDWLEILEAFDQTIWDEGEEEGDEPDEKYWDYGPEDSRFYFEKAK